MNISPMPELKFAVVSTKPNDVVIIGQSTEVELHEKPIDVSKLDTVDGYAVPAVSCFDLSG